MSVGSIGTQNASIEGLIQQYMAIERRPIQAMERRKGSLNTTIAMFTDLKSKLSGLKRQADDLAKTGSSSAFTGVSVSSANTDILTVSGSSGAAQGSYDFRIKQLATATTMRSTGNLNTHASVRSSSQAAAGTLNKIDINAAWADAGFDTMPDGTVTINGETFTLSEFDTVKDFMEAVNTSEANAFIHYHSGTDRFIIESTDSSDLVLSQTGENGFLTEIKINPGTYTDNNSGIDTTAKLYDANFDSGLSSSDKGSFKINGAVIEWDAGSDSLGQLIANINASNAGVTAFYDESLDRVFFTANETGSQDIEWEDIEGALLSDVFKLDGVMQTAGQDAKFTINSANAEDEISKSSNTFTINGLTFTLKQATVANGDYSDPGTTSVSVNSRQNQTAIRGKINSFLSAYNEVVDYIRTRSAVDTTTYTRGALAGENVFTALRGNVMQMMLEKVEGLDENKPASLFEIGITLGTGLRASISDSAKLNEWLSEDVSAVENLFNSENGLAAKMISLLEPYTKSFGIVDDRKDNVKDKISFIDSQIKRLETRVKRRESYYREQFTSMQKTLSTIVSQQQMLQNMTATLNASMGGNMGFQF